MKRIIFLIILLLLPFNIYAYSNRLIVGGEQIGIEIHSNGVYIIDFYNDKTEKTFKRGDKIISINDTNIFSINDFNSIINKAGTYNITIKRNNKTYKYDLDVYLENDKVKTGLYLKDEIYGIGTLSYIDPETKVYASLGHEILESNSNTIFDTRNGYIYNSNILNIEKNNKNQIGEIHSSIGNEVLGTVLKNKTNGIYGKFTSVINTDNLIEVGNSSEIKKGKATLFIELDNDTKKEYDINIINIDESDPVKNIYFEITDDLLLNKTGGIIQGMSGTPIIQNNKIIGAVNYVVIDDYNKGYGVFIEKMLKEGDKLLES
ncbi:MAG: hypothetical protein IKH54_05625 [Bacilli bacterium]|nr:hypothetical protein [Bacilli bacterium]MBR6949649.1 hypothetical protein [Bacilli bacterium]